MPEILLVNPRKRRKTRRKKSVAKKRRTAAQKAATRKMIAANKRRRKNPVATVRRRKRKPAAAKRRPSRRRAPQRRAKRRARRRNPAPRLTMRNVQNQLMDAGTGALGALGLDIIQGYLPIPANMKTGLVGTSVKALLAIGMGIVASNTRMIKGPVANKMVNGALTVVLHDEFKKQLATFAPGIPLGEYLGNDELGYYGSGYTAGVMNDNYGGMGSYLPELDTDDMGLEQEGLGLYESEANVYMEDMTY